MPVVQLLMDRKGQQIVLQPTGIRKLRPINAVPVEAGPPGKGRDAFFQQSLDAGVAVGDQQRQ